MMSCADHNQQQHCDKSWEAAISNGVRRLGRREEVSSDQSYHQEGALGTPLGLPVGHFSEDLARGTAGLGRQVLVSSDSRSDVAEASSLMP